MVMKTIGFLLLALPILPLSTHALPSQSGYYGEKVIIVDPNEHAWGAYDTTGRLVKSGLASAGSDFCKDLGRQCHTRTGQFRIRSLGSAGCKSPSFPLGKGGAPMPFCMYFNETQALHGYPTVSSNNKSHGCVRLRVGDARWLRFNFAQVGTMVIIKPYGGSEGGWW